MLMKKILLIISICLISVNSFADEFDIYKEQVKKCESIFKIEANEAETTAAQIKSANKATDCYGEIGFEIIEKHYQKNKAEMRKRLIAFVKATYDVTSFIYNKPDNCTPSCGTMMNVFYADTTSCILKDMILVMIHGAEEHKIN